MNGDWLYVAIGYAVVVMTEDELIEQLLARAENHGSRSDRGTGRFLVASAADVETFERWLGFPLPPLLSRIYQEVANGGVGPSFGMMGVPPHGFDVATLEVWEDALQEGEMPLVDWGCGAFSTIELHDSYGPVTTSEPGHLGPVVNSEWDTLHQWLESWLRGERLSPYAEVT